MPAHLTDGGVGARRFGGPGIKKKACLARICLREGQEPAASDDDDASLPLDAPLSATTQANAPYHFHPQAALEEAHAAKQAKAEEEEADDDATQRLASSAPSLASGSIDVSPASTPALRPCSPASGGQQRLPERQPLSPLVPEGSSNGAPCAQDCHLDVLSAMASQLTN